MSKVYFRGCPLRFTSPLLKAASNMTLSVLAPSARSEVIVRARNEFVKLKIQFKNRKTYTLQLHLMLSGFRISNTTLEINCLLFIK